MSEEKDKKKPAVERRKHLEVNFGGKEMKVPYARHNEFLRAKNHGEAAWRVMRIQSEFIKGYDFLEKFDRAVSIFGSARQGFDDATYREAEEVAAMLAEKGFAIFTGGGPGIMEAANRGAQSVGGVSVGVTINLPAKGDGLVERKNDYVDYAEDFDFFFSRKVILSFASQFYIFFPGGFGTLDELFEMLTLVQTKKTSPIPIILIGEEYWNPLVEWIRQTVYEKNKAISKEDLDIFRVVPDAEAAVEFIDQCIVNHNSRKDE